MEYQIGRFSQDEALAQLARDYVNAVGIETAERRADFYQQAAKECPDPTNAESFARHAEALRDAIHVIRETRAEYPREERKTA